MRSLRHIIARKKKIIANKTVYGTVCLRIPVMWRASFRPAPRYTRPRASERDSGLHRDPHSIVFFFLFSLVCTNLALSNKKFTYAMTLIRHGGCWGMASTVRFSVNNYRANSDAFVIKKQQCAYPYTCTYFLCVWYCASRALVFCIFQMFGGRSRPRIMTIALLPPLHASGKPQRFLLH